MRQPALVTMSLLTLILIVVVILSPCIQLIRLVVAHTQLRTLVEKLHLSHTLEDSLSHKISYKTVNTGNHITTHTHMMGCIFSRPQSYQIKPTPAVKWLVLVSKSQLVTTRTLEAMVVLLPVSPPVLPTNLDQLIPTLPSAIATS